MTARDGVELLQLLRPRTVIPVHYEGWSHFREGRAAVEAALAGAPEEVRRAVHFLEIGEPADITA